MCRSRRAGFTLLEVSVTLLILSVLAAFALPAFLKEAQRPDLDEAQARIEALFVLARDSAVRSATTLTVTIDSASERVWIDPQAPLVETTDTASPGSPMAPVPINLGLSTLSQPLQPAGAAGGSEPGDSLGLPPSVRLEIPQARSHFTFTPQGTAMGGDSLLLRGSAGAVRVLVVDPWVGRLYAR